MCDGFIGILFWRGDRINVMYQIEIRIAVYIREGNWCLIWCYGILARNRKIVVVIRVNEHRWGGYSFRDVSVPFLWSPLMLSSFGSVRKTGEPADGCYCRRARKGNIIINISANINIVQKFVVGDVDGKCCAGEYDAIDLEVFSRSANINLLVYLRCKRKENVTKTERRNKRGLWN